MRYRNFTLLSVAALTGLVAEVACSGPDPGYITFTEGQSTGTADPAADPPAKNDDPPKTEEDAGNSGGPVNATFANETYPAIKGACGSCHLAGTSGAPIFFGADANSSYPLFKAKGYDKAGSLLETKGLHAGPALTADQLAAVKKWTASEGGGGGVGDGG